MAVNIRCPICGTVNKGLDLEETRGYMECIHCKEVIITRYAAKTAKGDSDKAYGRAV